MGRIRVSDAEALADIIGRIRVQLDASIDEFKRWIRDGGDGSRCMTRLEVCAEALRSVEHELKDEIQGRSKEPPSELLVAMEATSVCMLKEGVLDGCLGNLNSGIFYVPSGIIGFTTQWWNSELIARTQASDKVKFHFLNGCEVRSIIVSPSRLQVIRKTERWP